ncbi:MAG: Integrase core domain, partial [Actinomycetota bacterium]
MEALRALSKELNEPGPAKLWAAAQRRGLEVTRAQVNEFAASRHGLEIFRPPQRHLGHFAAEAENSRWQADLAEMPDTRPPIGRGVLQHPKARRIGFLLCVDVYTRKAYTELLSNKTAAEIAAAFARIVARARAPASVFTDAGGEFKGPFDRFCEAHGIIHVATRPSDTNAIAVADRCMMTLKADLKRRAAVHGGSWTHLLAAVTAGYNARPHESVHGAPNDVKKNSVQGFLVKQDMARNFKHNDELNDRRAMAVAAAKFYRPGLVNTRLKKRVGDRNYGPAQPLHAIRGGVLYRPD